MKAEFKYKSAKDVEPLEVFLREHTSAHKVVVEKINRRVRRLLVGTGVNPNRRVLTAGCVVEVEHSVSTGTVTSVRYPSRNKKGGKK